MRAERWTVPMLPSSRSNTARARWSWSAARPARAQHARSTPVKDIAWFFGAKASIEGGITNIFEASRPSHSNASREKT